MLTKTLPAGTYVISADVSVTGQQLSASAGIAVGCYMQWAAGNQFKVWSSPWDSNDDETADGTISWNQAGSLTSPSTVTISCTDYSGTNGAIDVSSATISSSADIAAVQVTAIG